MAERPRRNVLIEGEKLRGAQKVARIPVKVIPTVDLLKKPDWIRVKVPASPQINHIKQKLREHKLASVCEEASCPNLGECFSNGTATFQTFGDTAITVQDADGNPDTGPTVSSNGRTPRLPSESRAICSPSVTLAVTTTTLAPQGNERASSASSRSTRVPVPPTSRANPSSTRASCPRLALLPMRKLLPEPAGGALATSPT